MESAMLYVHAPMMLDHMHSSRVLIADADNLCAHSTLNWYSVQQQRYHQHPLHPLSALTCNHAAGEEATYYSGWRD